MEQICLKQDNGADIRFLGRLSSECSWYDEENGSLTRQKLYVTDAHDQVYYIVTGTAAQRSRRAYRLSVSGDMCTVDNGTSRVTLQLEILMLAVRGLCGLHAEAAPMLSAVEDMLKAANA